MRTFAALAILGLVGAAGVWIAAGLRDGPLIEVVGPTRYIGLFTPLDVVIEAPGGRLTSVEIAVEQGGVRTPVPDPVQAPDGPDRVRITGELGPQALPGIETGTATLVVTATRPLLGGLREAASEVTLPIEIRYEPPRVAILSTLHYVNFGGAEMVVYRVNPGDVESGVAVGDLEYPGFPASGVEIEGVEIRDSSIRVAFFALLQDQTPDTPIRLFARDPAGNAAGSQFEFRVFPRRFRNSRITLDETFMARVVPGILAGTREIAPQGALIDQYVAINSELRRLNAETIASFAGQTAPETLWRGEPFHAFANTAVESGFADRRTYIYEGREVDRQVHLGYDLASIAQAPIVAANRGRVLFAGELGIYGNCVIIDHGMGLQSLYAHLSVIDVEPGDLVEREQVIGRSGMTGLAGGDHLHFSMLVHGKMVNPVEWWDPHWIEDRILRKLRAAQ